MALEKQRAVPKDGPYSKPIPWRLVLLDDLDNAAAARLDQNRAAVHDRVAIFPRAIFSRHLVIGNALFRQHGADPDILAVLIGRASLLDDIAAEAGTLVDAQNAGDTA